MPDTLARSRVHAPKQLPTARDDEKRLPIERVPIDQELVCQDLALVLVEADTLASDAKERADLAVFRVSSAAACRDDLEGRVSRSIDEDPGLAGRLAACIEDRRQLGKVEPSMVDPPQGRVFAIACGIRMATTTVGSPWIRP